MKKIYSIISLCFMAAALLVSCGDDEKLNTADVTVAFSEPSYSVKENKGIFTIPVVVEGEQNGPVYVDVEVTANNPSCKEDVNYLVTSKHIVINPAKKQSYVEIKAVDDRVINEDRQFTLTITNAEGAKINNALASTTVTLRDNDDIPYERMAGVWTVTVTDPDTNAPMSFDLNLTILEDENDPMYGSLITSQPWAIFNGEQPVFDETGKCLVHPMIFHHDEKTGKTTVDMPMGSVMADELDFGFDSEHNVDLSKASIRSATAGPMGLVYSGSIIGEVNDDYNEIRFKNPLYIIVYSTNNAPYMYYGIFENMVLKLKN